MSGLVHSGASPIHTQKGAAENVADLATVILLAAKVDRLQRENAQLRRDLAKALKPRHLKPLRESYARLLHRPKADATPASSAPSGDEADAIGGVRP